MDQRWFWHKGSPSELLTIPLKSTFQSEHNNTKQSIVLPKYCRKLKIHSVLYLRGIIIALYQNHMNLGRTNLFEMDIWTTRKPIACKPYQHLVRYQKFVVEDLRLLQNAKCISESLRPWATPAIIIQKKQEPVSPQKKHLCLVLDCWFLNELMNTAQNGNDVMSYYFLPNTTYLLTSLPNCTIVSSLDLRLGYHQMT